MAEAGAPTLEMRKISKTFPGVKALNDVQLKAWGGEVQALMGENGAGKSTLMKILSGRLSRRRGRRDPDRRQAGPDHRPDRRQARRHRHHLPGAEPRAQSDRGREHLSRRRDPPPRHDRPQGHARRLPAGARAAGRAVQARDPRRQAVDRRAAAGRDRPRPARQIQDPGARRADDGPVVARDRAPVRAGPPAALRKASP